MAWRTDDEGILHKTTQFIKDTEHAMHTAVQMLLQWPKPDISSFSSVSMNISSRMFIVTLAIAAVPRGPIGSPTSWRKNFPLHV